jgi:hypothetical protein
MSEQEKQENQKTIVAFAAGLLIGGLLVWIFGGAPKADDKEMEKGEETAKGEQVNVSEATDDADAQEEENMPAMSVGEGKVAVEDQAAGNSVKIGSATFPTDEGWVGVRELKDGAVGYILGAARFSKEQGLIPSEVSLVRNTVAGSEYALVFFGEDGDRKFDPAKDVQKEGVVASFKAQ